MDFRSKFKSRTEYRGYNAPCQSEEKDFSSTIKHVVEEVESYRGNPSDYLTVQGKRRRRFHPFRRFRRVFSETEGFACYGGTKTMWTTSYPQLNMSLHDFKADNKHIYSNGTTLINPTELAEFCEPLREHVIKDLYVKANSPRYDAAVALAELGETITGIRLLLGGAYASLIKTRKAVEYLKHFALNPEELWLWYRYALMPAILDVQDLVDAFKAPDKIDRIQDGNRIEDEYQSSLSTGPWDFNGRQKITNDFEVKYKIGLGGALDIHSRYDPAEWGTSAMDIVRAGWEVVPFSFLFDWFVNLGDWLTSLRSLEIVYAQSYATYAIEVHGKFKDGDYTFITPFEYELFLMERIVNVEPPTLPLIDKHWCNITRQIDLISLTIGMLKGILKRRR